MTQSCAFTRVVGKHPLHCIFHTTTIEATLLTFDNTKFCKLSFSTAMVERVMGICVYTWPSACWDCLLPPISTTLKIDAHSPGSELNCLIIKYIVIQFRREHLVFLVEESAVLFTKSSSKNGDAALVFDE